MYQKIKLPLTFKQRSSSRHRWIEIYKNPFHRVGVCGQLGKASDLYRRVHHAADSNPRRNFFFVFPLRFKLSQVRGSDSSSILTLKKKLDELLKYTFTKK